MIRFAFKKGLRFLEGATRAWTIQRKLPTGKIQLEDDAGELNNLEPKELTKLWLKGQLVIDMDSLGSANNVFYLATPRDLHSYDAKNQKIARERHEYISRLANLDDGFVFTRAKLTPILESIARELGQPKHPPIDTIYRWWTKFRQTKCVTKLVDGRICSGKKRQSVAYTIFEDSISQVYLTTQKELGQTVVESMKAQIKRVNSELTEKDKITMPHKATVYRWLRELDAQIVHASRLGKESAEREFRPVLHKLKVSRILERFEIDHTPLDVLVIDKTTMLPLGRPWLTLCIDRFSRMIMGFYITFNAPSSYSVLQCVKRSILPKDEWLARFPDIKESWPAYGLPELIATDNGMDLHSQAFEDVCCDMGIQLLFCPAGEPYFKGVIERMFRTMNTGLIHKLPGTVFSNIEERGDYPSEEVAAIDMETLLHLITKWIVEVYHRTKHKGIGMAPLTKWAEGAAVKTIELPAFPQQLDVMTGIPVTRTLFHYGIEHDCMKFNCPEIMLLRSRVGGNPKVRMKFYEDDISYIHVYDEVNKEYIEVPAVDMEYAKGLTRHLHVLIRLYANKKYGADFSDDQLLESKGEIQAIIAEAVNDKKMGVRKTAAVAVKHDSEGVLDKTASTLVDRLQTPVAPVEPVEEPVDPGLDDDLPEFGSSTR